MKVTPDVSRLPLERQAGPAKAMLSASRNPFGKWFVRINYSSLAILQTCMRKAQLSLVRGLKPRAESPATLFGTAIHKALEVFYCEPRENRSLPTNFARNSDLLLNESDLPGEHFLYRALATFVECAAPLRGLPDSDKRSVSAGLWLLRNYFETYIDDPFVVCSDANGPITERTCEAVLFDSPGLEITYFGTVDVVLRNEQSGVILPADHKTTSMMGNDFYKRVAPNFQYSGYLFLAQQCLGLETDKFLVNGLQVKARPVTARGSPPHLVRQVTKRTPEDIEDFKRAVFYSVQRYLDAVESGNWIMGDVNACAMYNGCAYHDICTAPHALREDVTKATYTETPQCHN